MQSKCDLINNYDAFTILCDIISVLKYFCGYDIVWTSQKNNIKMALIPQIAFQAKVLKHC